MFKLVYHYDNATEEDPCQFKTKEQAWDSLRVSLRIISNSGKLNSVEILSLPKRYYVVGYRIGETWLSIHSIHPTVEGAEIAQKSASLSWTQLIILTELDEG